MAKYYKWYKALLLHEYAFAIPIRKQDTIVTITILSPSHHKFKKWSGRKWWVETTYVPPAKWQGMAAINSIDEKTIYDILKGQKGKIITAMFALRL